MKPDFVSMLVQAKTNEAALRGVLSMPISGGIPAMVALVNAHSQAVETVLALKFYLDDNPIEDTDPDLDSLTTSSLDDDMDIFERLMEENKFKPDVVVPRHRWKDKL